MSTSGLDSEVGQIPGMSQRIADMPYQEAAGYDALDRAREGRDKLAPIETEIENTNKQELEASKQRQQELAGREQQLDSQSQNEPKDNMKHVMQQSPLFMALAALAGSAFKSSAITGLGAMNGMVQGIVKGDRQQYDDQWKEYDNAMQTMKMRWDLRDQVYNELKGSFQDTREGLMHRWQVANAAIGVDAAEADRMFAMRDDTQKLWTQALLKYQEMAERRSEARMRADTAKTVAQMRLEHMTPAEQLAYKKYQDQAMRLPMKDLNERLTAIQKKQATIRNKYADKSTGYSAADQKELDELSSQALAYEDAYRDLGSGPPDDESGGDPNIIDFNAPAKKP